MKLDRVTDDNDFLCLKFYNELLSGHNSGVSVQRRAPFVAKYSCISRDFELLRLLRDENQVCGIAAMAFIDGLLEGRHQPCAIGADLKIARSRQAVIHWPELFVDELKRIREQRGAQYVFSALGTSERAAYNTFIRPRSLRRNLPRYYLYRRFKVVNIHGFLPGSAKPSESLKITNCTPSDFEQLTDYIQKKCANRPLSPYQSSIDVADQIIRWPNYKVERFLIARDKSGTIVGCLGLWDPSSLFQFHISNPDKEVKLLHRLLILAKIVGWGHPLSMKLNIRPIFLTHINTDHPDIFASLIRKAWSQIGKHDFLSYIHFDGHAGHRPPPLLLRSHMNYTLYLIQLADDPIPPIWPASENDPPPVFEIPYI